jgi:hypothetical protein
LPYFSFTLNDRLLTHQPLINQSTVRLYLRV